MESIDKFITEHSVLFFAFAFIATFSAFAFMYWRRSQRGIVLPNASDPDVVFVEKFASGSSDKSWMTRMGGANNCLTVIVTQSKLAVTTFFPFTALAETYDLEHLVPITDITALTSKGKVIVVEYQRMDGTRRRLSLRLRDPAGFIRALERPTPSEQAVTP